MKLNAFYEQELEKYEKYASDLANKKSNSALVESYIRILEKIERYPSGSLPPLIFWFREYLNEGTADNSPVAHDEHQSNEKRPASRSRKAFDNPQRHSYFEHSHHHVPHLQIPAFKRNVTSINEEKKSARVFSKLPANHIIHHIQNFYRLHPDGVETLADKIIQRFTKLAFGELSLRTLYEDLTNQVSKALSGGK